MARSRRLLLRLLLIMFHIYTVVFEQMLCYNTSLIILLRVSHIALLCAGHERLCLRELRVFSAPSRAYVSQFLYHICVHPTTKKRNYISHKLPRLLCVRSLAGKLLRASANSTKRACIQCRIVCATQHRPRIALMQFRCCSLPSCRERINVAQAVHTHTHTCAYVMHYA